MNVDVCVCGVCMCVCVCVRACVCVCVCVCVTCSHEGVQYVRVCMNIILYYMYTYYNCNSTIQTIYAVQYTEHVLIHSYGYSAKHTHKCRQAHTHKHTHTNLYEHKHIYTHRHAPVNTYITLHKLCSSKCSRME